MTLHLPTTIRRFENKAEYEAAKKQNLISENEAYIIFDDVAEVAPAPVPAIDIETGTKTENGYTQHFFKTDALEVAHGQRSDAPEYYFEDFAKVNCGNIQYAMKETRSSGGSFEGHEENLTIGNLFGAKLEQTDPFNCEVIYTFGQTKVTETQIQQLLKLI